MKHCSFVSLCFIGVAAIGLSSLSSDGQVGNFTAPVQPPAVVAVPGTPAPSPSAADPFQLSIDGPAVPGHASVWFQAAPSVGMDAEAHKLQQQERALERSTRQLLEQIQNVESAGDRSPILDQLAQTVQEHFEVRQQVRARELEALEARVRKLRQLHDKREEAKREIIRQRVELLVREAEGLGWSSGSHAATQPGKRFLFEPTNASDNATIK